MPLIKNEQGVLFPLATILLFFITGGITIYLFSYDAEIISYNALESSNVRATIKVIEQITQLKGE